MSTLHLFSRSMLKSGLLAVLSLAVSLPLLAETAPVHTAAVQQSSANYSAWGGAYTEQDSEEMWQTVRVNYFADRPILEGDAQSMLRLKAPGRAENDAQVPVSITTQLPEGVKVHKIYLLVDVNPIPMGGMFTFPADRAVEQINTSVRVNGYTYIRAVLETTDGKLYMDKQWVKSTGAGCSAPPGVDQDEHRKRLGKVRFKLQADNTSASASGDADSSLLMMISHPNNTGMQRDQLSTLLIPELYVKNIEVAFNDTLIMQADTSFTLSENPSFSFSFSPEESGILHARIVDSAGNQFDSEESIQGRQSAKH